MPNNNSGDIFIPLPTCGNNCLIDGLKTNYNKVIAQDGVEYARTEDEEGRDWEDAVETDDEFTEKEKAAVVDCYRRHLRGVCVVRFVDEVE